MAPIVRFVRSYFTPAGVTAARNLGGQFVFRAVSQGCHLLTFLLLANALAKPQFGSLLFALALIPYLVQTATLSTGPMVLREAAAHPERWPELSGVWWAIRAGGTCSVIALAALACCLAPIGASERSLYLILLVAVASACFDLTVQYDLRHRQAAHAAVAALADASLLLIVWCMTSLGRLTLPAVGAAFAAKFVLSLLLQFALAAEARPWPVRFRLAQILEVASSSWRLGVVGLLTGAPMWAGVFLVRAFHGEGEVANYGLAVQAASIYLMIGWMGNRVLAPHIVGPYGGHRSFITKLLAFLAAFHGSLLVLGVGGSAATILLLFPPQYRSAIVPTALAMFAALAVSLGQPAALYLLRAKRESSLLSIALVSGGVFLAIGLAVVGTLGSTGVWTAALIASAVGASMRIRQAATTPPETLPLPQTPEPCPARDTAADEERPESRLRWASSGPVPSGQGQS